MFGALLPLAVRYAELLATTGVAHGLLGPREAGRIWSRHLLNSAVVAELIPPAARIVDVGSGAGLPGLALALARPDARVTLVEPLQRRTQFLLQAVAALDVGDRVTRAARPGRGSCDRTECRECRRRRRAGGSAVGPCGEMVPTAARTGRLATGRQGRER